MGVGGIIRCGIFLVFLVPMGSHLGLMMDIIWVLMVDYLIVRMM